MHFSKVRSLTLDSWEPELLKVSYTLKHAHKHCIFTVCVVDVAYCIFMAVFLFLCELVSQLMCELGNGAVNQIYEARREELGARKPQPGDPRYGRWERQSPCDAHCFSRLLIT